MEKIKRKVIYLLRSGEVEKKVTFQYNGKKVQLEILMSPQRDKFFTWLTTNKGDQHEMSFPRVLLTRHGIKGKRHCLGKDLQVFIPYSQIDPEYLVTVLLVNQEN